MPVPLSQMFAVTAHVLKQRLRGRRRYPLVLMLEPLLRCNLACAGCGKIQYPAHILKRQLTPEECFKAAEECGAPMVSIPGGEPLLHPQIEEIVAGLVARGKYVYLCTNALLLKEKLHLFKPDKHLSFSVHLDGEREAHDFAVCREGTYDLAVEAIREALRRGFRVTTNTTLFDGASARSCRNFFDEMSDLGVEGMMLSPGYSYDHAPDQGHFLGRQKARELFRKVLSNRSRRWRFNQSPLFLEFLMGRREYECTPWGMPTYNVFGWQKPCYLLQEGYAGSYAELLESTAWENYGWRSGNPKCANCMVHSGYEASAVAHTFSSISGLAATMRALLFNRYSDDAAARALEVDQTVPPHLVQLTINGSNGDGAGPGSAEEEPTLQGRVEPLSGGEQIRRAARDAFAYRGDVTLTLADGRQLEGYVANVDDQAPVLAECHLRLLLKDSGEPVTIGYDRLARVEFTGRDTASGKSFHTWLKNYQRRRAEQQQGGRPPLAGSGEIAPAP